MLSEKLEEAKFHKRALGYSLKEVDEFLNRLLNELRDEEERMRGLRATVSAFEARAEEITKREKESRRILETAKKEAENILAAAKKDADAIVAEAKESAAAKAALADLRARELAEATEHRAAERIEEAKQNAEMILAAADRKGRTLLAEAQSLAIAESQSAEALATECAVFESRFRTLVADTVRALGALKGSAPTPIVTVAPAEPMSELAEPAVEEIEAEAAAPRRVKRAVPEQSQAEEEHTAEMTDTQDIPFAGGQPLDAYTKEVDKAPRRKLYDTVTVSYAEDDGFSDVRKLMEDADGKPKASPVHFSE